MRLRTATWRWGVAALVVVVALGGLAAWRLSERLPKRFAAVVDGRLYRSGAVTVGQLERLRDEFGITRVICLLDEMAPETQAEEAAARRLGMEWCNVSLPGNGASTSEDRRRILELLQAEESGPTLVHCAAGVNRTGLAVGLYRLHCEGWTLDQVMAELRDFDFRDLPKHENLRAALAGEAEAAEGQAIGEAQP